MAFSNSEGCPTGWTRDEWMKEVPRNSTTGQFESDEPCDLPLVGYWICGALLILARICLGCVNLHVIGLIRKSRVNMKKRTRGMAPLFDMLSTIVVILFICLAPVTSSRDGTSWVLFGLSFTPYFIGALLFIVKMIRNRRRMEPSSSSRSGAVKMPRKTAHAREDVASLFGLILSWIGLIGAPITWIVGAAAFGGLVLCHRIALGFFCLMTATSQILAFRESVLTSFELSRHMKQSAPINRTDAFRSVRFRLMRSALTFAPVWMFSTVILLCLATGVLPFYWYITYILLCMPVINAAVATSIFLRRSRTRPSTGDSKEKAVNTPSGNKLRIEGKLVDSPNGQWTTPSIPLTIVPSLHGSYSPAANEQ